MKIKVKCGPKNYRYKFARFKNLKTGKLENRLGWWHLHKGEN